MESNKDINGSAECVKTVYMVRVFRETLFGHFLAEMLREIESAKQLVTFVGDKNWKQLD